ncbi:two-component system sensor histidine kinase RppB [Leptolyngbya sp. AN03gr2]|uniref:two-component system sensor histidine kinase RppB n=1 Tax=unclassified Leptolyngbya TaxID=2650499 RepID=UPI003D322E69
MRHSSLFNRTRAKMAGWYAVILGLILGTSSFITYQMVAYAHWQAVDRELESISGTLHDSLEPKLKQPGKLEPMVEQVLPGLCQVDTACSTASDGDRHILGIVQNGGYYIRFLDLSGRLLATAGASPGQSNSPGNIQTWQVIRDHESQRYHQYSLTLKTSTGQPWGYLQIGRSLREYDEHLAMLRILFLFGFPGVVLIIAIASWWLAGLAMKPVYDSYARMQQFTADAAHELRTPIATLRATVETAQDSQPISEQETQNLLSILNRQSDRLAQLVQDLLLLSRMDQKTLFSQTRLCCLNDLISDLVEDLSTLNIAAPIQLSVQIRVSEQLYVMGDENQLIRLFSNLITNALHYTPPGGQVIVTLEKDEHQAVIQIRDTGIGIAPKDQARIFDRFYRVNSDRSRQTGGSGLGLAIAQAIAKAHDGKIEVESTVGKGSTFTVRLPLQNTHHLSSNKKPVTFRWKTTDSKMV